MCYIMVVITFMGGKTRFFGRNVVCSQKQIADCVTDRFLSHILTLLDANSSHLLANAIKFSCCFSNEIRLLCLLFIPSSL